MMDEYHHCVMCIMTRIGTIQLAFKGYRIKLQGVNKECAEYTFYSLLNSYFEDLVEYCRRHK